MPKRQLHLLLHKKKIWRWKKYKKEVILENDRNLFWPIFYEFEIKQGPTKLKRPVGRQKKKELHYFTWEDEFYPLENSSKTFTKKINTKIILSWIKTNKFIIYDNSMDMQRLVSKNVKLRINLTFYFTFFTFFFQAFRWPF